MNGSRVRLTILSGGACLTREIVMVPGGRLRKVRVPALFGLIEHPGEGPVLFDVGYHTRFQEATCRLPYRLFRMATPLDMTVEENPDVQLRARGIAPEEVRWVVVSHFDPDHIGGLRDFPASRVVCAREAWEAVRGRRGLAALKRRLLPGLLPEDLEERLHFIDGLDGPAIGPFEASYDLFGDGTLRLVSLPGHSPGQLGAYVAADDGLTYLFAADGCWTRDDLDRRGGRMHPHLAVDRAAQNRTYELLREAANAPGVVLVPAHCPRAASELVPGGFPGGARLAQ